MFAAEGTPQSSLVIEVLLEPLNAATVDATPSEVARQLIARGVGATATQVRSDRGNALVKPVYDSYPLAYEDPDLLIFTLRD